ncbi:monogalactosyldiacylglycerol synthase [Opitutaceae bacterium TAV5]|nr:monogalactosyldiacylglycerol synthase [Opitutaceae bacterium TAV5]
MKRRVLVLTAGFGEGHNAAARALAAAFDTAGGEGTARVTDLFALAAPRSNAFARRVYLAIINGSPRLWSAIYRWTDRSEKLPVLLRRGLRRETRLLAELVAQEQPAAICSTYPVYAYMLETLAASGRLPLPPHFNIVTDSISINALWWRAGAACAGWFLPNEESAAVMRAAGVEAARLHVAGFPVGPFFGEHAGRLSLPDPAGDDLAGGCAPRVLYIINSGSRGAEETARRLLAERDWDITITVGRNRALHRKLLRLAAGRERPATILGWTNEMPRLLMTHHVVVTKAGGATTQEALAARCPMIVNQIVPGQEEGNYELLRRHGIGDLAESPGAVVDGLRRAFAERARVWRAWREATGPLSRPSAAHDIVAEVIARTFPGGPSHAEPARLPVLSDSTLLS